MTEATSVEQIVAIIESRLVPEARLVIGISGYGGSGKSTLARDLISALQDAARVRGDDFLDPTRSHHPSADWDGVDRRRLADEVLIPFRAGRPCHYRKWDWAAGGLSEPEMLPECRVIVVDAVGLFHPEVLDLFDLRVWIDVDLDAATRRGKQRDLALGRRHDHLWDEVWVPNERRFEHQFAPQNLADLTYSPAFRDHRD